MSIETDTEIEIPCYFICPISMQLMKDPVTVSTGITYDRESIEKWLFSCKNKNVTCPVTKQSLQETDLTPNLTLRRLIQAWCTLNAHDRIPTPKPSVDKSLIQKLLSNAKKSHQERILCLHRLSSIAHRDDSSKNYLQQSPGAVDFLLSVVTAKVDSDSRDQALNILRQIELSDSDMKKFLSDDGQIMDALINVLENGNSESRANAVIVLKSVFDVADPCYLIGSRSELFLQTVRILTDKMVSKQAVKAALKLLVEICPWGRNRVKAVESGAVSALIELLLESSERRLCELILIVLDQLCSCADGRAELLRHGAGLAIVSKKVLRVSHVASERAVRIIASICKYSASSRVLMEMLQVGVVTKLCLVLQVESGERTKERAKEMLRLHSRVWKNASCIPSHLLSYYPSSK